MLFSFVIPAAKQLRYGPDYAFTIPWIINLLWDPTVFLCFGCSVFGGLFLAYGKNAVRPWLGFIFGIPKPDRLAQPETISILNTAQKLVTTTGLIMCGIGILRVLANVDQGILTLVRYVGWALVCLINAGLISLLFIVPVRAYWEGESLSDNA